MGIFSNQRDEARQVPRTTLSGTPQITPESPGSVQRRFRLFAECVRRTAEDPAASPDRRGVPVGDGLGMEGIVARFEPIFTREQSLIRWVALRGALAALQIHTLDPESRVWPFYPTVELVMGVGHVGDVQAGDDTIGVSPEWVSRLTTEQVQGAVGLFSALASRLYNYDKYSRMDMQQVNSDPLYRINHAVALDFIGWAAIAFHRLGIARELILDTTPEPDALSTPGWYTEPLWGRNERYWNADDWTTRCRTLQGRRYIYAESILGP